MKCSFCGSENPSHANYCMDCGSPQDLAACRHCGALNRKNAATCQKCAVSLSASVLEPSVVAAGSLQGCVKEAEALAQEAQKFKQLFDELEQDVKRQKRDDSKPVSFSSTVPAHSKATPTSMLITAAPKPVITLDRPSAARDLDRDNRKRRARLLTMLAMLLVLGGVACYTILARNAATPAPRSLAIMQPGEGVESTAPISLQRTQAVSSPPVSAPAAGATPSQK